jgi:hypothetical protein
MVHDAAAEQGESRHERRLDQCVRELGEFVEKRLGAGCEQGFSQWAEVNMSVASRLAGEFLLRYVEVKSSNASLSQLVRLYRCAWRGAAGIEIPSDVERKILRMNREQWVPAEVSRINVLSHLKSDQYEELDAHWTHLIGYLGTVTGSAFKEHCAVMPRSGLGTAMSCELDYLGRKGEDELQVTLLRTRAFCTLMRATGMRSTTAIDLQLCDLTEVDGGGVLLHRMESKSGSKRNVTKDVFVGIVPHADPRLCPLVHLAEYVQHVPPDVKCIFAQGFSNGPSLKTQVQRRLTAVLHAVAHAINAPDLFKAKQMHSFRVLCTNVLMAKGASETERNTHVGWASSIQSVHYASKKHAALNARTPYLLANRSGQDELPHPMWLALEHSDGSYWLRVRSLAAAAGYVEGVEVDPAFKALVAERIAAGNPEKEDSPAYLLKRVRDLEAENQELRKGKRTRASDAADRIKTMVAGLKERACDASFPAQCVEALPGMMECIEEGSERGSFLLTQSSPEGKALGRILLIAGVLTRFGAHVLDDARPAPDRSWLAWVADVRADHQLLCQISMKSLIAFKASLQSAG